MVHFIYCCTFIASMIIDNCLCIRKKFKYFECLLNGCATASCVMVHEMLEVAREVSGRTSPSSELISYGEFCLLAAEVTKQCAKKIPRSPISSKISIDPGSSRPHRRGERSMSKPSKYEVFLGGSCNPTTWRQDIAIPTLKRQGISYYNPQVSHWEEELVQLECQAKQNATVLFFVFDPSTRNISSMVEGGFLSGSRRKLILVVNNYTEPGQHINGEPISESEYEELKNGLLMVQDLAERQSIPVFRHINHALNCTAKILRENIWPQELDLADKVQPVKYPHLQLGDKLVKLHDAFVNTNSNKITLAEASVVFKVVTDRDFTKEELQIIVAHKKGVSVKDVSRVDLPLHEIFVTFEEFCCIVSEFENEHIESKRLLDILTQSIISPIQKVIDWALQARANHSIASPGTRDIYLGGTRGSWRESIAIPLLRKHGLSYYVPCAGLLTGGRFFPMEAAHLEKSRTLLFVITNNTRGASAMTLAAHYIGLGCDVVLCIQMLKSPVSINGEQLSDAAVKDYNRGRTYLSDQANKEGIPVFSNIEEAVECVVQKCRPR